MENERDEASFASLEARCKSNTHRLDRLEERQDNMEKLVATVEVLATKQDSVESDVREIKADVKALTSQPGKRWEALVAAAMSALVGGLIAYLLCSAGLK